jgi:hypothetical protein
MLSQGKPPVKSHPIAQSDGLRRKKRAGLSLLSSTVERALLAAFFAMKSFHKEGGSRVC